VMFGRGNKKGQAANVWAAIIAAIGQLLGFVWGVAKEVAKVLWEFVRFVFDNIIRAAPTPIKIIFFLVLFSLFGAFAYNTTFGLMKECDAAGNLWETSNYGKAIYHNIFEKSQVTDELVHEPGRNDFMAPFTGGPKGDTPFGITILSENYQKYVDQFGYKIGPCEFKLVNKSHNLSWQSTLFNKNIDSFPYFKTSSGEIIYFSDIGYPLPVQWVYALDASKTSCYQQCVCPSNWPGESCVVKIYDDLMPSMISTEALGFFGGNGGWSFDFRLSASETPWVCYGTLYFNDAWSFSSCNPTVWKTGAYSDQMDISSLSDDSVKGCVPPSGYYYDGVGDVGEFVSQNDGTVLNAMNYEIQRWQTGAIDYMDSITGSGYAEVTSDWKDKKQLISYSCEPSSKNFRQETMYVYGMPIFDIKFMGVVIFVMIVLAILGWVRKR